MPALEISYVEVKPRDFRVLMRLGGMTSAPRGSNGGLRAIQAYYLMIETMGRAIPTMASWAERERVTFAKRAYQITVRVQPKKGYISNGFLDVR
jgi:hypothetical protein